MKSQPKEWMIGVKHLGTDFGSKPSPVYIFHKTKHRGLAETLKYELIDRKSVYKCKKKAWAVLERCFLISIFPKTDFWVGKNLSYCGHLLFVNKPQEF